MEIAEKFLKNLFKYDDSRTLALFRLRREYMRIKEKSKKRR